ncbi:MAG: acetate/propionate family kinase [Rhodocyclaceae bacterium]|nr:acetate/propionate family kinase [Rhodocyclaceae bacterium]
MTPQEVKEFLIQHVRLFEGFPEKKLDAIVAASQVRSFEGKEAIRECGDPGEFFGVLLSGQAEVSVTSPLGERTVIGELKEGDVFGEMSLLTGDRSVTDILAVSRCFVLMIPQAVFTREIVTHPPAVMYLSRLLAERVKQNAAKAIDITSSQIQAQAVANAADPYLLSLKSATPGRILALNVGHAQIRFGVYDTEDESLAVHGIFDRVEAGEVGVRLTAGGQTIERRRPHFELAELFNVIFDEVGKLDGRYAFMPQEVVVVGHRVVHGGSKYYSSTVITPEVMQDIERLAVFAPYHNPVNLAGIKAAMKFFPAVPHVAVFDTAFHQTLPTYAYMYGLPYEYYKRDGIRRYGFHGTSHRYVSLKSAEVTKRPLSELEIVSCHLGIGSSMCAIDHGRSVDTTMGLTPSEGLIMASRAGNLDPALMIHFMEHYQMSPEALSRLINAESGLKGISGISGDIREIEAAAEEGHHRALLAHRAYCYQIRKTIGAYVAAMGGIDVLAFTGRIGEQSAAVRSLACQGLEFMGIKLDEEKNRNLGPVASHAVISAEDAPVKILVIASNDERLVAWEALRATERVLIARGGRQDEPIPIEISAHHVHLSQEDVDKLFGPGYQLTPEHELSQPGQFACAEKVNLIGPKGRIENVRVLGPTRKETQVEIAMTEQFKLGIQPPIRESGDLANTPGITLEGPAGTTTIPRGVICAQRHIHMSPEDAMKRGLRDKYVVRVRVEGERELIFGDVVVRVHPNFRLAMHIDTDEGNAANIRTGMVGYIDEIQARR